MVIGWVFSVYVVCGGIGDNDRKGERSLGGDIVCDWNVKWILILWFADN